MTSRTEPSGFALAIVAQFAMTFATTFAITIASDRLGSLVNRVERCDRMAPWHFGLNALMANLARRGLLGGR